MQTQLPQSILQLQIAAYTMDNQKRSVALAASDFTSYPEMRDLFSDLLIVFLILAYFFSEAILVSLVNGICWLVSPIGQRSRFAVDPRLILSALVTCLIAMLYFYHRWGWITFTLSTLD